MIIQIWSKERGLYNLGVLKLERCNDISFYFPHTNITKALAGIPIQEGQANQIFAPPNTSKTNITWENFRVDFIHPRIEKGSRGMMVVQFAEKW